MLFETENGQDCKEEQFTQRDRYKLCENDFGTGTRNSESQQMSEDL